MLSLEAAPDLIHKFNDLKLKNFFHWHIIHYVPKHAPWYNTTKILTDMANMVSTLNKTLAELEPIYKSLHRNDEKHTRALQEQNRLQKQAQDIADREARNEKKRLEIEAEKESKKNWENKLQISNKKHQQDSELENENPVFKHKKKKPETNKMPCIFKQKKTKNDFSWKNLKQMLILLL